MRLHRSVPLLLVPSLALVAVACSDDSGDEGASVDPTACNNSIEVVDAGDAGGVDGQFGAEIVIAAGGPGADEEAMQIAISGFDLPDDTIPEGDPEAPDDTNVLVVSLAAPEGGFADGQSFTDGDETADGEITSALFYRGPDEVDLGDLTVTLGEITDPTVCGAIEADGAGVEGEFKAERVGADQPAETTTSSAG